VQEQAVQEQSVQWQDAVFVDGEFRRPAAGGTIGVRDKATGEIFASAGLAGQADVDQAVAIANHAQPAWAERTYAERAGLLRDVAVVLGVGQSGLGGRSGGDSNIEEFTERRWLTVNPGPAHYPY
jgi:acyl-CoA reductase-like NAD-dependent aldehyde dehydrogenase